MKCNKMVSFVVKYLMIPLIWNIIINGMSLIKNDILDVIRLNKRLIFLFKNDIIKVQKKEREKKIEYCYQ